MLRKINRPQIGLFFCAKNRRGFSKKFYTDFDTPPYLHFWYKNPNQIFPKFIADFERICCKCSLMTFICRRAQKPSRGILILRVLAVCIKRKTDAAINCLSEPLRAVSNVSLRYCQAAVLVKPALNLYIIAGVFINLLPSKLAEAVR